MSHSGQRSVRLRIAPGIWRDPDWILDDIDRRLERGLSATVMHAAQSLARANRWRCEIMVEKGEIVIAITPSDHLARHHRGRINSAAPVY